MRLVAQLSPKMRQRTGFARAMLVTDPRQGWVDPGEGVLFTYGSDEDGPCSCQWPFTDLAHARRYLREKFQIPLDAWIAVPEQLPGCLDDWVSPVRLTRPGPAGADPLWERYTGGAWVAFDGPPVPEVYPPAARESEPSD